jgi:MFS family permease
LKNSRAIYLLLLANSISGVSQGISMLAVPWYFTGIIHRGELFGKAYFIITVISLAWGVYAGTLIDRYSRKKIFLVMNIAGLCVLSAISGYGFLSGDLHWLLVVSVFATTAFIYNIHFPNLYAFAHEITEKSNYGRVTSLLEIQGQITFAIAGGLSAILLNGVDHHINFFGINIALPFSLRPWKIYEIFAIDAVTYLIAFAIIYRIKSLPVVDKQTDTSRLRERIRTGFGFLIKNPLLLHFGNASLFVFVTILVFGTYVQPVYVDSFLHQGGDVYAFGDMAFSLGALLAGFLTTRLFAEKHTVMGIILLSIMAALMYFLMASNSIVSLFFAANFVIGVCNAAIRIQRVTYLFHHVPNHLIGRTNSVLFVMNVSLRLCLIGAFTLPFFHHGTNVIYATAGMGLVCLVGALILSINYRRLLSAPEVA